MSGGSRAQGDAQLANSERGLASIAGVTATRAASFKTITALRAERPFGAVSTVTQRTGTADQNGGVGAVIRASSRRWPHGIPGHSPGTLTAKALCINQPVAQSRAEGALEFPDADTGAAALLLHPPGREIEVAALRLGIEDGQ